MITRLTTLTTTQKTYSSNPVISTRSTGLKRRKEWKRGRECPKLKIAFSGLDSHLNRIFSLINQLTVFSFTHDIGKLFIFVSAEQSPCSVLSIKVHADIHYTDLYRGMTSRHCIIWLRLKNFFRHFFSTRRNFQFFVQGHLANSNFSFPTST